MKLYPIQLNLTGKQSVVVGAGSVAERKARTLLECGSQIRLVAPRATPVLSALAESGDITWTKSLYDAGHLEGAFLVIAATDLAQVNANVARDAGERGILVCNVDDPTNGNFIVPAQVSRGDLLLTVSTSGQSPTLASVVRNRLEEEYNEEWAGIVALFGALRPHIQQIPAEAARKNAARILLGNTDIRELARNGDLVKAEAKAIECLLSLSE